MLNREQRQVANRHYDSNNRVKFRKLSDLSQFFRSLYFYIDKTEDIFGFLKRQVGFGADKAFLQGWLYLANVLSFFRGGKPTPTAFKIFNDFFERLIGNLSAISIFVTAFQGLLHICKTLYVLGLSKDKPYTRTVQFLTGLGALALIAISIAIFAGALSVSAPILSTVGAARGITEHALIGLGFIYERFFSERSDVLSNRKAVLTKKYIDDNKNFSPEDLQELLEISREQREGNEKIINKIQGTWLSTGFLVGSVLLFTPLAPAGTILLISLTAFALADAVLGLITKQNTTRWVARGLNAFAGLFMKRAPFNLEVKTEKDIELELRSAKIAADKKRASLTQQNIGAEIDREHTLPRLSQETNTRITATSPSYQETRKGKEKALGNSSPTPKHKRQSTTLVSDDETLGFSPVISPNQGTSPSSYTFLNEKMTTHSSDEQAKPLRRSRRGLAASAPERLEQPENHTPQNRLSLHFSPSIVRRFVEEKEINHSPSPRQI